MKTYTRAALAAVFAATAATPAFAQLNRVGPVGPLGYPTWYQDKTGITLEFCDSQTPAELAGGWCVLLPPDVPNGAPETRNGTPVNFGDEHFYYVMNAGDPAVAVPGGTTRVLLVAAIEGAFANEAVIPGDEMVFARLRIRVDSLPYNGTYTVYTPFGKRVFEDQVAGERLFSTEDVGITAGNFQEALHGSIFPFVLPSARPGGPELPPVSAQNPTPDNDPAHFGGGSPTAYPGNGRRYIADPARLGPVTGSPHDFSKDGVLNPNVFRIEITGPDVPNGKVVLFETFDFSLAGRLYEGAVPGAVSVNRASYAKSTSAAKIDVYATAEPITASRVPGAQKANAIPSNLVFYNAACVPTLDAAGNPGTPYNRPTAPSLQLRNTDTTFFAQMDAAPAGPEGCLEANAITGSGQMTTIYLPVPVNDQVTISQAIFDPTAQTLTVKAVTSDATLSGTALTVPGFGNLANGQLVVEHLLAPPATVTVTSSGRGSNTLQVTTTDAATGAAGGGGTVGGDGGGNPPPPPPATAPIANNSSSSTIEEGVIQIPITSDPSLTVQVVANGALGVAVSNGDGTVTFTPNKDASGTDAFAFTLTNSAGLTSNTATVTVSIAPVNDAPTAVAENVNAILGVTTRVNLMSNDIDPDGAADLARVVIDAFDPRLTIVGVEGGFVTFTAKAGSSVATRAAITYHVVDSLAVASGSATASVQLFTSETITPTRWQYTINQNRWVVTGTVNPNLGQTMTISYASGLFNVWNASQNKFVCTGNAANTVVGTAVVDGTGTWSFDQPNTPANSIFNPTNSNNNAVNGNNKTSFWCTTPTVRITSSATGGGVTAGQVQVK